MNIKPIKTEKDYHMSLKRLDSLMDAAVGSVEGDELEILSILIEKYEEEKYPITTTDPVSAIKFRLEQRGYNQTDFAKIVGSNRASEILNRQREIPRSLIKKIHKELGIPYESLLDNTVPVSKKSISHNN